MSKIGQLRGGITLSFIIYLARKTRVSLLHKKKRGESPKKPERIKPILITRGLKTRKHKKLKQISSPLWHDAQ